jgi:NAD(P)-dependent dehydrogenase (short-subunit alcohol dehydrogenase family)
MAIKLDDTIALVTGAAGGIGRAVCQSLKAAGATVVATDIAERAAIESADEYHCHDVTSESDWARIAARIAAKYGRLDALVNNAGIALVASIRDTTLEAWRKVQSVNVESMLIGTRTLLDLLITSGRTRPGGASIVNFSSVGGLRGAAYAAAYCTSKGAVKLFSKSAAIEFGMLGYNIRVNSIHPGGIHTEMLHSMMQRYVDIGAVPSVETSRQAIVSQHPIGRIGNPEEIGGGVVYLCSTEAGFVTGSELVIDGGFSAV